MALADLSHESVNALPEASSPYLYRSQFSVGGISVQVAGFLACDAVLPPSLVPFRVPLGLPDVFIAVDRVAQLRACSPPLVFDSDTTWILYAGERSLQFDFEAAMFGERPFKRLFVDESFATATLQISEQCQALLGHAVEPLGYPLDELLIMHRLTQEKAIELHGTGIVRPNGEANLFVGHSGAGKSTTTRLWTATEEVEVLSDDRIIVRRDKGAGANRGMDGAANRLGILQLRETSASLSSRFFQDDKPKSKIRMYGTPWHGEAMFASPNSAPLTRIFVLEHGHGNVITPLSPSQAVAELFARSFVPFHRHEYVESALVFLEELVDVIPVYRYAFEPDQRAVDKILHFHD
ncbi:MAG TPA: hypothetical protein VKB49_06190 [Candidatus Sulfotelmatobacter sp.]|nr:hypothetical protein [Candidatus Sulfotelmatobacter sp.]